MAAVWDHGPRVADWLWRSAMMSTVRATGWLCTSHSAEIRHSHSWIMGLRVLLNWLRADGRLRVELSTHNI